MLKIYRRSGSPETLARTITDDVVWIDLLTPSEDETAFVEQALNVRVPTESALSEIEASSRLVAQDGLLYLSSPAVGFDEFGQPHLTPVGFVIGPQKLLTIRFLPLPSFDQVSKKIGSDDTIENGMCVFTTLLEAMVDRGADVLEELGTTADALSKQIFKGQISRATKLKAQAGSNKALRQALSSIGELADRLARARDVLLGVGRIATFADDIKSEWINVSSKKRLEAVSKDIVSLEDYETRLSDKIQLLLDAILGFINIQQNELFKILTIVSVVAIPPTILVGVWGMNFKNMPELNWVTGYPLAWAAIIASGLLPLLWFKWRGWFD